MAFGKWNWPKPAPLTRRHWNVWQKAIALTFLQVDSHHRLLQEMQNAWNIQMSEEQKATYWMFSEAINKVFLKQEDCWIEYLPQIR